MLKTEKTAWLIKGIGGLLCVGLGLSIFGEAVAHKINQQSWFWLGTLSLVVFNFGLCLMFDSHNHQLRLEKIKENKKIYH